jgi:hypothetical protein
MIEGKSRAMKVLKGVFLEKKNTLKEQIFEFEGRENAKDRIKAINTLKRFDKAVLE